MLSIYADLFQNPPIRPPSDTVYNLKLAANTPASIKAPAGAGVAVISATAAVWVRGNALAAVPAAHNLSGTGSELNPASYAVSPGDTLSFVSEAACLVSVAFYKAATI